MFDPRLFQTVYRNSTNSYKFYWWLAIMEIVRLDKSKTKIEFTEIIITILAKIWYPVNYFKLSFGKQDKLANWVVDIQKKFEIRDDISEFELVNKLIKLDDDILLTKITKYLTRYVPFRFIRPWFTDELKGVSDAKINSSIINFQTYKRHELPYHIDLRNSSIILNEKAKTWMLENYILLESFTYYELIRHLEKNNKNVSSLNLKLIKPGTRNLATATKLWNSFIQKNDDVKGVFDPKALSKLEQLSIDHYLPWSFVTHDKIWNLHPVEKNTNSSKNNLIPEVKLYFKDFVQLQYEFSRFLIENKTKALEDYYFFFRTDKTEFAEMKEKKFHNEYIDFYLPQIEVAHDMGYNIHWAL